MNRPPCYKEEPNNPYPLCVGLGVNCAHCCLWTHYEETEDEDIARSVFENRVKGEANGTTSD